MPAGSRRGHRWCRWACGPIWHIEQAQARGPRLTPGQRPGRTRPAPAGRSCLRPAPAGRPRLPRPPPTKQRERAAGEYERHGSGSRDHDDRDDLDDDGRDRGARAGGVGHGGASRGGRLAVRVTGCGRAASPQDPSGSAVGASEGPSCRGPDGQSSETAADGISEVEGQPSATRRSALDQGTGLRRGGPASAWVGSAVVVGTGSRPRRRFRGLTARSHRRKGHGQQEGGGGR